MAYSLNGFQHEEIYPREEFEPNKDEDWMNSITGSGDMHNFPSFCDYDHEEHLKKKFTQADCQVFNQPLEEEPL